MHDTFKRTGDYCSRTKEHDKEPVQTEGEGGTPREKSERLIDPNRAI